jgi:hypothetical protein
VCGGEALALDKLPFALQEQLSRAASAARGSSTGAVSPSPAVQTASTPGLKTRGRA